MQCLFHGCIVLCVVRLAVQRIEFSLLVILSCAAVLFENTVSCVHPTPFEAPPSYLPLHLPRPLERHREEGRETLMFPDKNREGVRVRRIKVSTNVSLHIAPFT